MKMIKANREKFGGFTQNQLKVIAAVFMAADHVGVELFPQLDILRIIGRLSFPIFAFFIYEGCKYTHSKPKYLARIFLLGLLCMAVYYIYEGEIYGNILITMSLSICVIYALQFFKSQIHGGNRIFGAAVAVGCICGAAVVCSLVYIDYGICGVFIPVFAEIFGGYSSRNKRMPLLGFSIGLLLLSWQRGGNQYISLLSLPLLAAYNGERGKRNMKYFFYWFYPVHLAVIGAVSMIMGR
ncbi:MAG: conjugal transfer protein TraX [Oscillospiraceae bacterium]|nr:conjugal transfer protein TraX [Oscillospiraceae bacterium]